MFFTFLMFNILSSFIVVYLGFPLFWQIQNMVTKILLKIEFYFTDNVHVANYKALLLWLCGAFEYFMSCLGEECQTCQMLQDDSSCRNHFARYLFAGKSAELDNNKKRKDYSMAQGPWNIPSSEKLLNYHRQSSIPHKIYYAASPSPLHDCDSY